MKSLPKALALLIALIAAAAIFSGCIYIPDRYRHHRGHHPRDYRQVDYYEFDRHREPPPGYRRGLAR